MVSSASASTEQPSRISLVKNGKIGSLKKPCTVNLLKLTSSNSISCSLIGLTCSTKTWCTFTLANLRYSNCDCLQLSHMEGC